jgi:ribosome maturation factor RimP
LHRGGDVTGDGQHEAGSSGEAHAILLPSVAEPAMRQDDPAMRQDDGVAGSGFANQVREEVAPTVRSFGFELVELDAARLARRSLIRLVVYRSDGMTANDCAQLARALRYRLALVPGAEDARLEVSTPGTARKIKAPHEYSIFRGRTAEVLVDDGWLRGVIVASRDGIVTLDTGAEERQIELPRIRKGRLSDDMIERNSDGDGTDVQ